MYPLINRMCLRRNRRLYVVLWLFALTSAGSASLAGDFCTELEKYHPSQQGDMSLFEASGMASGAVCATSRALSGAVSNHCYWSFPYRSAASTQSFDAVVQRVADCANAQVYSKENTVNHPDTYDLRRFTIAGKIVDVSLKDKAALQQTIVFLRISGAP
ncbi:hypothetical protein RLO149_c005790 [Roseobacter litoralis Och 149]|uniref:Uncharacterized protein n=1 Tax=Roseobacter litoralis (strain ATCC 49566 / DSM 6996 / JCM 21268 / NBRC 15278 / OCh 149) TaxID=391595 RepID=F7ZJH5_ROSLO|nr:hypothetical protein RLO149_c005790 [Roseobacter litoralis Och 149]